MNTLRLLLFSFEPLANHRYEVCYHHQK